MPGMRLPHASNWLYHTCHLGITCVADISLRYQYLAPHCARNIDTPDGIT